MRILVLDGKDKNPLIFPGIADDFTFIQGEEALSVPKDPARVDVIIGRGDCSPGSALFDGMLGWRTHQHTYLVPCMLPADEQTCRKAGIWPRLAIDRFNPDFGPKHLTEWLEAVTEWQQNRMHFGSSGSIEERSPLELITSLCLRRASGTLSIVDEEGGEGSLSISEGNLVGASFKHLRWTEAFYEFLCLSSGWYTWEANALLAIEGDSQPASRLIHQGLEQIQNANLLYHFIPNFDWKITRTDSESALDDSASASFVEQKELYDLIEGEVSVSDLLVASPLSRPSTMVLLSKWFSLEDIAVRKEEEGPPCRVLVVDDSPLMCRALQSIFSEDPRIQVAGVAHDGVEALRLIGEHEPDVVTLDLQMPKMDGLTALKHISIQNPKPVVVVSAFTKETSRSTYESFKYGAVDVISKPENGTAASSGFQNRELCERVLQASNVQLNAIRYIRRSKKNEADTTAVSSARPEGDYEKIIIVLCGAGGFPSLLKLVFALPEAGNVPPTVISTAMSSRVLEALIANLRRDTRLAMEEVSGPGFIDPGGLFFLSNENCYQLFQDGARIGIGEKGTEYRESRLFDELLMSASDAFGSRVMVALISGTGEDGIQGMQRIKQAGGQVFALSPEACLRPDLARRAIDLGLASEVKTVVDLVGLFEERTLFGDLRFSRESEKDQAGLTDI
ncbi:MAG: response regulator [Syntrophobacter sp.]